MRIASYNIRKAVGLDWKRDPNRIVDVLAETDADVVVLQEADRRLGTRSGVLPADLLRRELQYEIADVSVRPHSHGWHGNAILYRTVLPVVGTSRIDLPVLEPRGAVALRLAEPDLEIIGTHLALTSGTRRRQAITLRERMTRGDHAVVLAGDLNEWQRGGVVTRTFGAGFQHIVPGNSFHAACPVAPLDRFILSDDLRCIDSYVHTSALAKRASDHLPIVIYVEVRA